MFFFAFCSIFSLCRNWKMTERFLSNSSECIQNGFYDLTASATTKKNYNNCVGWHGKATAHTPSLNICSDSQAIKCSEEKTTKKNYAEIKNNQRIVYYSWNFFFFFFFASLLTQSVFSTRNPLFATKASPFYQRHYGSMQLWIFLLLSSYFSNWFPSKNCEMKSISNFFFFLRRCKRENSLRSQQIAWQSIQIKSKEKIQLRSHIFVWIFCHCVDSRELKHFSKTLNRFLCHDRLTSD